MQLKVPGSIGMTFTGDFMLRQTWLHSTWKFTGRCNKTLLSSGTITIKEWILRGPRCCGVAICCLRTWRRWWYWHFGSVELGLIWVWKLVQQWFESWNTVNNEAAIAMINTNQSTMCACHIEIQYFAFQEWRAKKELIMWHIPRIINPSDDMTKALGWVLHSQHPYHGIGHYWIGSPRDSELPVCPPMLE